MKVFLTIVEEIWGLFVDDGSLAVLSLLLIVVVSAAVKLLGLPGTWGGVLLGVGCLGILAYSVDRAVRQSRSSG